MARPYISWSIDRIETLFEEEGRAPEILAQIKEELSFRTTKRAQNLLRQVNAAERTIETSSPTKKSSILIPEEVEDHEESDSDGPPKQAELFESWETAEDWPDIDDDDADDDDDDIEARLPDDRHIPAGLSRIRPLGTPGLPESWTRPLDQDLSLDIPADADIPDIYCAALAALIAEIKRTGSGQKRYELEKGGRRAGEWGEFLYDFPFTDDAELFEDAKVEVELPGQRIEATIVSISAGRILLAVREDLGPELHRAVIVIDATALLEALREKIEQVGKGELLMNRPPSRFRRRKGNAPPP